MSEQRELKTETVELSIHAGLGSSRSDTVLSLSEEFEIAVPSLDEVLRILNRFHELAENIRNEQAGLTK